MTTNPIDGGAPAQAAQCIAEGLLALFKLPDRVDRLEQRLAELAALEQGVDREQEGKLRKALTQKLAGIDERLGVHGEALVKMGKALTCLSQKDECLEHASRLQHTLSEQFYDQRIIQPMCRMLFPLYDLVDEAIRASRTSSAVGGERAMSVFTGLQLTLVQFLETHGIEPSVNAPGSPFDPRCMTPLRFVRTLDPSADLTVMESIRAGFVQGEKILRPQSVVLFRFETHSTGRVPANSGGN